MNIQYIGHACFRIKSKLGTVVIDPYDSKMLGTKLPKLEADIVTISHDHEDHNASDQIEGDPLVLTYPGEYEKNGIRVYGFETYHDKSKGEERGKNTMFKFDVDGVTILHCGDLGHTLSSELLDDINGADVVMIPVGGFYTIDADEARQVVEKLEPSIVIPMHYKNDALSSDIMNNLAPVDEFIKKIGVENPETVSSLKVAQSDLTEDMQIVIMEPKS